LEAIKPFPRAQRESSILSKAYLRAQAWFRGAQKIQRSGIGPERALEAIKPFPRAQRESSILSKAYLRAQAWFRGAPATPNKEYRVSPFV
jgi:hypothetical protein